MNDRLWLDPDISLRLCLTLLHSLWIVALLAALARLADRIWRRSVERRYLVHVSALLAALVALPVTYALVGSGPVANVPNDSGPIIIRMSEPHGVEADIANTMPSPAVAESQPTPLSSVPERITGTPDTALASGRPDWQSAATWIVALYAIGVFVMLGRLAHALLSAQRQAARAALISSGPVFDTLAGLARDWSLRIAPAVAVVERIAVPQVVGLLRPMILLPASSLSGLTVDELQMILAHELAHVRRHDLWVNLLQRLAETVLFFNPGLWYLTRRISLLREFCCDELTCRSLPSAEPAPRTRYAATLLRVAELSRPPHIAASELTALAATGRSPSELRRRIAHLFGEPIREPLRLSRGGLLVIVAGIALLLGGPALLQTGVDSADSPPPVTSTSHTDTLRISGTCTTSDGTPVRNAEIHLYEREIPSFEVTLLQSVRTDDDGRYQFKDAKYPTVTERHAAAEPYAVTAKAEGRASVISFLAVGFKPSITMDFRLKPAAKLQGRVTGRDSRPVAGADVWIRGIGLGPLDRILSAKTDAEGHYEIIDAEAWRTGDDDTADRATRTGVSIPSMFFRVRHPEYGTHTDAFTRVPSTVDVALKPAAVVEGRVIIAETGAPAGGVLVRACSRSDPNIAIGSEIVRTSQDGRYRMALPESNYNLWAHHDELTVRAIEGFAVTSGETNTAPDLQLIDGGLVSGQLVDAGSGEPVRLRDDDVAYLTIHGPARPTSSGAVQRELIQPDGSFEFRLPEGRNELALPHSSLGSFQFAEKPNRRVPVDVVDGETSNLKLRVQRVVKDKVQTAQPAATPAESPAPPPSVVALRDDADASEGNAKSAPRFELLVIDPQGQPVPNAEVELRIDPPPSKEHVVVGEFVKESTYGPFARTDAEGRLYFSYAAEPRYFNLNITTPGYGPYWAGWSSEEHPQAIPTEFTAELETGWSVGGTVVDEQGQPVVGVQVKPSISYKKRPGDEEHLGVGTRIKTDDAGRWRFDSVPASMSEVWVEVSHPEFSPLRRALTRAEFGLEMDQAPTVPINLPKGLTIAGHVADADGNPIEGALLRTKFSNDIREARTDAAGNYRIPGCEARMTRVVVSAPGRATDMQIVRVDPDMRPVNFTMQPGGKVRIRVVDEQGQGIPKARIFLQRWRGMVDYFEFDFKSQYADERGVWEWHEAPLDEFQADICRPDGMQLQLQKLVARDEEYVFTPSPSLVASGSVVDAATKETIKNFRVTPGVRNENSGFRVNWDTSASYDATDGAYRIRFDSSSPAQVVRIEADGYRVAVSRDIKPDEGETDIDFELQPATDIAATVMTPDGPPAAGAKVALAMAGMQVQVHNGDIDDDSTYATMRVASADGSFRFPSRNEPFQLVITHLSGYAWIKSPGQVIPSTIELTAWAKIEGVFRVGAQSVENVTLAFDTSEIWSYGQDRPSIHAFHAATTGPGGRYVFERVVPGKGRIGREIQLTVDDGATEAISSVKIPVTVPAGEVTTLDLGGNGRAVIGRLSPTSDAEQPVLWNFAQVTASVGSRLPAYPTPPADFKDDQDRLEKWWQEWSTSPEGKALRQEYNAAQERRVAGPRLTATVARDGSFRIDDVPPGEYVLDASFNSHDRATEHPPGRLYEHAITVPAGDDLVNAEPLDLGVLQLE